MASKSFGGTIKLQGESEYRKALNAITDNLRVLSSEMKVVTSQYDKTDKSTSNLTQQNQVLNKKIQEQKEKVDLLTKALEDSKNETGDNSTTTKKWQTELNNAQAELNKLEKNLDDNTKSMNDFGNEEEEASEKGLKLSDVIKGHLISDAIKAGLRAVADGMKKLVSSLGEWADMSNELKEQEAKVTRVMKNTTDATDEQIKSIIELTAQQEKLGVVSQETQLAGLQELGTYVTQKESIEKLLPVMNDMIAQQYGIGASMESASGIATMMGKVLGNGQVDALSRLGYKFDDTQKKVLKFGTEQQKVAMLTEIITQSVGGMNQALAETDAGKMTIARSKIDDLKKSIGETYNTIKNKLVVTISQYLLPILDKAATAIKKWAESVNWNKVGDTIKKALQKVIDAFKWIVDNAATVIKVIGSIIAAFAVSKIVEFGKKVGDVITGMYEGIKTLFALIAAHPLMALAAGVAALATAYLVFRDNSDAAVEAEKRHLESLEKELDQVRETADAWQSLKDAQQEQIDKGMTQMAYYENLNEELKGLVDSNGKVKEGYEARASFIVDTLADALDIEINKNSSLASQIKQIEKNIDKVIEKKKAQIILNSQEALYQEAISNQAKETRALADAEDTLNAEKERLNEIEQEILENKEKLKTADYEEMARIGETINSLEEQRKIRIKSIEAASETYQTHKNNVEEYTYNIALYEKNMELAHKEAYDQMSTATWDYIKEYQSAEDAQKAMDEDKVRSEQAKLRTLLEMRNENNAELIDAEIEKQKKIVEEAQKGLDKYNYETDEKLKETQKIWNADMDLLMSDLTGENVRFYQTADGNVQMYVNGVKTGLPQTEEAMKEIMEKGVAQLTQNTKYEEAGKNIIEGVRTGVNNQKTQGSCFSAIYNFGTNLLNKMKAALQVHSPSKATAEMGEFLDEGLILGIRGKQGSVTKEASKLGNSLLDSLNGSLNRDIALNKVNIQTQLNKPSVSKFGGKNDVLQDNTMMVNAIKKALEEVKVVMNGREMGQFITKTVEKEVFS